MPYCTHIFSFGEDMKMDLKEIVRESVDWIHPAQYKSQWWALVYAVMNLRVPLRAVNFLTS
jgi:hypothetical protein